MTTADFYSQALLAALPITVKGHQPVDHQGISEDAHNLADALTKIYKLNHGAYLTQ